MNEVEMIDLYEELIETLQTLNTKAPEIEELYNSVREELEHSIAAIKTTAVDAKDDLVKAEVSGLDKITELSSGRKKQIDDQIKALDDVVKKASNLQEKLGGSTEFVQQINGGFAELSQLLKQIESGMEEQQQRYSNLEERLITLEERLYELMPIEIDYDEIISAIDLYNKYNGRINRPIVLEKPNYTNEFCFRVSGADEEQKTLIGRYFRKGKLYGEKSTFPYSAKCRMYNGDTLEYVIAAEI